MAICYCTKNKDALLQGNSELMTGEIAEGLPFPVSLWGRLLEPQPNSLKGALSHWLRAIPTLWLSLILLLCVFVSPQTLSPEGNSN